MACYDIEYSKSLFKQSICNVFKEIKYICDVQNHFYSTSEETCLFFCRFNSLPSSSTPSSCCSENAIILMVSCGGLDSMPSYSGSYLPISTRILTEEAFPQNPKRPRMAVTQWTETPNQMGQMATAMATAFTRPTGSSKMVRQMDTRKCKKMVIRTVWLPMAILTGTSFTGRQPPKRNNAVKEL